MRVVKVASLGLSSGVGVFLFYSCWIGGILERPISKAMRSILPKLPWNLNEGLMFVLMAVLLGAPVLAVSLLVIQHLGPKPGRVGWPWLLGMPVVFSLGWAVLLFSVLSGGLLERLPFRGTARHGFGWFLLICPILLWNLGWAWEAVRRERSQPPV